VLICWRVSSPSMARSAMLLRYNVDPAALQPTSTMSAVDAQRAARRRYACGVVPRVRSVMRTSSAEVGPDATGQPGWFYLAMSDYGAVRGEGEMPRVGVPVGGVVPEPFGLSGPTWPVPEAPGDRPRR
jgi:hypothetical protein